MRKLSTRQDFNFDSVRPFAVTRPAEVVANIALCLIHQATFLLERQLRKLEAEFVVHGGLRERMTKARLLARGKSNRE
ncbi:MAG: four helix bundle suffix domain-containing protein [Planctomycetota bacterium]